MTKLTRRIVIVGGGSAGWLTAGILAAEHSVSSDSGVQITLVESPDVNPIGVGEGTWPSMRHTLQKMGLSETDFVRECDAAFKQASRFDRWVTGENDDSYYHPFTPPHGFGEVNLASQWRALAPDQPFAEVVSHQPHLCAYGLAPKQITAPEWAAVANYAYHLDAGKFGQFLQKHCVEKLGVKHILDHVKGVKSADNGDIESLLTEAHGAIEGDLYIDCTGFSSLLLGQHFGVPFISLKDTLFCDTALAMQVPYPEPDSPVASVTISTAQEAGWIWDIGLPTRRGTGYVYSSSHTSDDEAERVLRHYLQDFDGNARKISINPGHRELFWHRNCVAVGISAGFIEPLEASALALIELSAAMIRDELPVSREAMEIVSERYNERFRYRWDRIIDFLKLHYVLSQRSDSDFWLDNRKPETIPGHLLRLLELWRYRPPSRRDFHELEEIFPASSYWYVLYGMGFEQADVDQKRSDDPMLARQFFEENAGMTEKYIRGLPSNRQLIEHMVKHGIYKI
jgi:flavin-dependent dehydrogenase